MRLLLPPLLVLPSLLLLASSAAARPRRHEILVGIEPAPLGLLSPKRSISAADESSWGLGPILNLGYQRRFRRVSVGVRETALYRHSPEASDRRAVVADTLLFIEGVRGFARGRLELGYGGGLGVSLQYADVSPSGYSCQDGCLGGGVSLSASLRLTLWATPHLGVDLWLRSGGAAGMVFGELGILNAGLGVRGGL